MDTEIDSAMERGAVASSAVSALEGASKYQNLGVEADDIGAAQHELQALAKVIADALWTIQQQRDPSGAAAAGAAAAARVNDAAAALDSCLAALPDYELDPLAVVSRLSALEATYSERADAAGMRASAALADRVQLAKRAISSLSPSSIAADVAVALSSPTVPPSS